MQNFHLFMSIMGKMFGFMGKFFKKKKRIFFYQGKYTQMLMGDIRVVFLHTIYFMGTLLFECVSND